MFESIKNGAKKFFERAEPPLFDDENFFFVPVYIVDSPTPLYFPIRKPNAEVQRKPAESGK